MTRNKEINKQRQQPIQQSIQQSIQKNITKDSKENILTNKQIKQWYKKYNNNKMRQIINIISPYIKPYIGYFFYYIHVFFMIFSVLCLCLSNNILHLSSLLLIMALDVIFILTVHQCPLTILEKKYLGTSINHKIKENLQRAGINYRCNHIYESQLECVITMCSMISSKMFVLIFVEAIKLYL